MYKNVMRLCAVALALGFSFATHAAVIVNADTTTDTTQGLEFLHINQTSDMTYGSAQSGFSYGGFFWRLATVDEFLQLMEGATGDSIPDWNGSNLGDVDFDSAQADAMMAALGYGPSSETPWFWLDGQSYGAAEVLAHTSCCDDFHLYQEQSTEALQHALFVKGGELESVPPVPSLTQWGLVLLVLLMIGFGSAYIYRRS